MEVRNGKLQMVGSILVGGLVGAGIALLFAPQSGRRTRRDLRHFGKKVLNKSEAIGMDLRNSIERLAEDVSERLQDGVERGRDWAKKATRDVHGTVAACKTHLQGGMQRVRRAS
jgi:gas vesicle protein